MKDRNTLWEYKIVKSSGNDKVSYDEGLLCLFGKSQWELVSVVAGDNGCAWFYFKREITNEQML